MWSKFIKSMELLVSCDLFFKVPTCTYTGNKEGSIRLTTNNGSHLQINLDKSHGLKTGT